MHALGLFFRRGAAPTDEWPSFVLMEVTRPAATPRALSTSAGAWLTRR